MLRVATGEDPQAIRAAQRAAGTFAETAARYLEEYAKKRNKSWKQADALVREPLLPPWAKLAIKDIARSNVRAVMGRIDAPIVAV